LLPGTVRKHSSEEGSLNVSSDGTEKHESDTSFLEAFERPRRTRIVNLIVWLIIIGVAILVVLRLNKPREASRMSPAEARVFDARFDSLYKRTLYPVVWRSGTFIRSRFEGDFEEWTLTISSSDWELRSEASRKDLVATIWIAYRATREQAGGDPDDAVLIIQDEQGRPLAQATPAGLTLH